MPAGMESNCITIHKLLEYQPVYYEVVDPETGEEKKTMRFEPTRTQFRPLPSTIKTIIIDESSMVSVELFQLLVAALPHTVQWIFLGDIQQLPPIFGSAILGFKMLELPTVELTQVYRQALESPIISYATDIKDGKGFILKEKLTVETPKGKVTFHPWKKKLSSEVACLTFCKFITTAFASGVYSPDTDMILMPFNKAFGTIEVNKQIANHRAKSVGALVWEIVAGFNKLYFSVGDKVLYDKEDAVVTRVVRNAAFYGKRPQHESVTLDYWGHNTDVTAARNPEDTDPDIDAMLDAMANMAPEDSTDRVRAASHIVTVTMVDSDEEIEIDSASGLNSLLLSYALTVHKAQGSEWDKVFLVLHQSHATMCQRELLYTAVTRAAKELYVICEPETFERGVASQRIKGNTLKEKAEFFKGKLELNGGSY
jgi:exodeoxyribonuclease V alpha subunit